MKTTAKLFYLTFLCIIMVLMTACNRGVIIPDAENDISVDVQSLCFSGKVSQHPFYDSERIFPSPCANALVEIVSVGREPEFYAGMITDASGEFVFDGVPAGNYEITVEKDDYYYNAPVSINAGTQSPYNIAISFKGDTENHRKVFYAGTNSSCDLNADGVNDVIQYGITEGEYGWKEWSLKINGKDFTDMLDRCDYPSEMYSVIDIDTNDPILHLALNDYGPSDDYSTRIFEYDGQTLKRIGWIEGVIEKGNMGFGQAICCGDGSIITYTRLGVLQTWHAYDRWVMRDGELVHDERDYLYVIDSYGARLTTLSDLTVYLSPDKNSEKAIIPVRTPIHLTQTDNEKWVACETPDCQKYWILLDEQRYGNVMNGDESWEATAIFDGVCYAD